MTIEPKDKTIERVINYCKSREACGDWEIYNKAKLMLNKITMTAEELEKTITKITGILFV